MDAYYELRSAVVEMFYENLLAEHYTIGQTAGRCLVEFQNDLLAGDRAALVILSVLLSRVARHEPATLVRFTPEVENLQTLASKHSCWAGLTDGEKERLKEDLRFTFEKAET